MLHLIPVHLPSRASTLCSSAQTLFTAKLCALKAQHSMLQHPTCLNSINPSAKKKKPKKTGNMNPKLPL